MQIRILLVSGMALVLAACGSNEDAPSQPRAYGDAPDAETIALGERPKSFSQCAVCHSVEPGENGMGPTLAGVFGAKAGHIADFAYSTLVHPPSLPILRSVQDSCQSLPSRFLLASVSLPVNVPFPRIASARYFAHSPTAL